MSSGLSVMAITESDVTRFLTANTHIGSNNVNFQMESYIFRRRPDGLHIFNLRKTYEKLVLAARAIAAIENPSEVYALSSRPMGQRAVLKFARYTGATPIAGRYTPGAFTNQIQAAFREPRLLVVTDPLQDHQPIVEASYVNIPVVAFCNTDSPLRYVDVAIPCNNKSAQSVGLMWWMLAREVLRLRGTISRKIPWEHEVMPDLFFYRDPDEQEKEEGAKLEATKELEIPKVPEVTQETWGTEAIDIVPETTVPAPAAPQVATGAQPTVTEDWAQNTEDWAAVTTTGEWGGDANTWD